MRARISFTVRSCQRKKLWVRELDVGGRGTPDRLVLAWVFLRNVADPDMDDRRATPLITSESYGVESAEGCLRGRRN